MLLAKAYPSSSRPPSSVTLARARSRPLRKHSSAGRSPMRAAVVSYWSSSAPVTRRNHAPSSMRDAAPGSVPPARHPAPARLGLARPHCMHTHLQTVHDALGDRQEQRKEGEKEVAKAGEEKEEAKEEEKSEESKATVPAEWATITIFVFNGSKS